MAPTRFVGFPWWRPLFKNAPKSASNCSGCSDSLTEAVRVEMRRGNMQTKSIQ